ncbi:hypothetical protein M5K25_005995 [Dendrobium thyrsiflorum]|uniref:DNA topoisomerase n=1 Tax=Dendrobium thyrsiflorum TaxID=117978 RepID=A0ABD0VBR6_DENTH
MALQLRRLMSTNCLDFNNCSMIAPAMLQFKAVPNFPCSCVSFSPNSFIKSKHWRNSPLCSARQGSLNSVMAGGKGYMPNFPTHELLRNRSFSSIRSKFQPSAKANGLVKDGIDGDIKSTTPPMINVKKKRNKSLSIFYENTGQLGTEIISHPVTRSAEEIPSERKAINDSENKKGSTKSRSKVKVGKALKRENKNYNSKKHEEISESCSSSASAETIELKKTSRAKKRRVASALQIAQNKSTNAFTEGVKTRNQQLMPLYPPSGKSVVVVESVTKARVIQDYLGEKYEVLASYGHVRDLARRSGSVRPDDNFSLVWEVPSSAWTHLKSIKIALSRQKVTSIRTMLIYMVMVTTSQELNSAENLILASDPDREGEAIAWHIIEMLQLQDALNENINVARVVFHEITESSIKSALQAPREIDSNLVNAYLARRALDYLIGFSISPLLWRKLPGCQSAGRVQSAALALICNRETEIEQFKPQEYWTVGAEFSGTFSDTSGRSTISSNLTHINSKRSISSNLTHINSKRLDRLSIISKAEAEAIQKKLAQQLYEGIKLSDKEAAGLITYMRTDGMHISNDAAVDINSFVGERYGGKFASKGIRKYFKKVKNAQEAHEAIRPTNIRRLPSTLGGILDGDSLKLYSLIWSRTMACQMESASIDMIQVDIGNKGGDMVLRSVGSRTGFLGYEAVYKVSSLCECLREIRREGDPKNPTRERQSYSPSTPQSDIVTPSPHQVAVTHFPTSVATPKPVRPILPTHESNQGMPPTPSSCHLEHHPASFVGTDRGHHCGRDHPSLSNIRVAAPPYRSSPSLDGRPSIGSSFGSITYDSPVGPTPSHLSQPFALPDLDPASVILIEKCIKKKSSPEPEIECIHFVDANDIADDEDFLEDETEVIKVDSLHDINPELGSLEPLDLDTLIHPDPNLIKDIPLDKVCMDDINLIPKEADLTLNTLKLNSEDSDLIVSPTKETSNNSDLISNNSDEDNLDLEVSQLDLLPELDPDLIDPKSIELRVMTKHDPIENTNMSLEDRNLKLKDFELNWNNEHSLVLLESILGVAPLDLHLKESVLPDWAYHITPPTDWNENISPRFHVVPTSNLDTLPHLDRDAGVDGSYHKEDGSDEAAFVVLQELKVKDSLSLIKVDLTQHYTKPPSRYSEGALVKKLEELGIGRPSTYASIMKVLQDRSYVTMKNRVLHPEFRGRMVSEFLSHHFSEVTNYSFTADMETELDNVSAGTTEWKGLLRDYWSRFIEYCNLASNAHIHQVEKMLEEKFGHILFSSLPNDSRLCPSCEEGTLRFKVSRFGSGYFIGCDQHPRCKFIAGTIFNDDEDTVDADKPESFPPKLLGYNPGSNEKIYLKNGPYGHYVQLGDDRTGCPPKRSSVTEGTDIKSITLEDAIDLLQYPINLGNHPDDGHPVLLKHSRIGFSIKHRRTVSQVPKSMKPKSITLATGMKLLNSKNAKQCGRPKGKPKSEELEEAEALFG